jgi:hypothetical protein
VAILERVRSSRLSIRYDLPAAGPAHAKLEIN